MAVVANMPGRCPRDSRELDATNELYLPSSQIRTTMDPSPPKIQDELFFSVDQHDEANSPSYLVFEPVISSVSNTEPVDWKRYDPPQELLQSQENTSEIIKSLLAPSIATLRQRHAEELERLSAVARRGKPLARASRASARSRVEVSMSGALQPSNSSHRSRLSGASNLSLSSVDSGYASRSPDLSSPSSSKTGTRPTFGLSTLFNFRRKDKLPNSQDNVSPPLSEERTVSEERTNSGSLTGECVSCLDDFETSRLIKLSCHSYCTDCFQRLISTALESETHWPAKCCLNSIPTTSILPHIDDQMKKKYYQREAEWSIPAGDRVYCPQPNCGSWISMKNINTQLHSAKCPKCSQKACTICRGAFHDGNDCPQDPNLQATINLAQHEGWRRCYNCQALVEHNKGCRHMTCRCKAQFCYICGLRWRTCACTDTQLAEIQQQATARRNVETVRTAQALAAAEEERIILQMVADFERAEAEREAREAEARLRIEEEERRRREEEHIAAISLRFHQLGVQLESLHDIQHILIAERYESEVEAIQQDRQTAFDTLSIRHAQEIQFLGIESQAKITDSEHKFEMEYQARLIEERRIENEYIDQLKEYWKGKADAAYKIRDSRDELRRDQDKEYRFWDAYRRKQLRAIVEGESRKMEALRVKQQCEIKAVEGRATIDEVELKRTQDAEGKWIEEVTRERVTMLQNLEQEQYSST